MKGGIGWKPQSQIEVEFGVETPQRVWLEETFTHSEVLFYVL